MTEQEKQAAVGIKRVLLELQSYALWHSIDHELGNNVDALLAVGALSHESAVFVRTRQVEFFGFDSRQVDFNTPVLQISLEGPTSTCRFIGFIDGHVERREVR